MDNLTCKKCGSENLTPRPSGVQTGVYCDDCGAWVKWLKKSEIEALTTTIEPADIAVMPCYYCDQEYVIPFVYDGGITSWENIDAVYCPMCGRRLKNGI